MLGDYPFPNLPYIIDGDIKITQSNACLRYIGKRAAATGGANSTILGASAKEAAECEFVLEEAMDFRNATVGQAYCT